ncbi:hypothetical protein BN1723_014279 [Verticillium longisporum]|uniref:Carboxylic ester hydrolase n=1 Tax=Verticillium longisporum TaxID=100787 RepID=A0A0G4KPH7_VERLO|nr:hypothetical protein BN1708_010229 [Verticillium longisporum]CRK29360.1 hypothetical protein BN1723_014279 [Verticillium longisporum]
MLSRVYMLFLAFCQLCLAAEIVPRATFSEVTGFGANPTNTKMYLWVPNNLAPNPAIVVGIHWCSGNAQAYYQGSNWARLSETYGYIVIYPSTAYTASNCWDVSSQKTLTRGAGGNSDSIANMVKYVTAQYGADASRVFVTGISSGAMMTNVMAATYPDLFQAGIAYAGVPAGCFSVGTTEAGWNSTCANGQSITTPEHWAAIARAMAPGYTGRRPRMQVYHGDQDAVVFPQNYYETVKQWAGIFGYSTTPQQTISNFPRSPYNKYVFGPNLEGILGVGVSHSIDVFFDEDLKWFGITVGLARLTLSSVTHASFKTPATSTAGPTSTTRSTTTSTVAPPVPTTIATLTTAVTTTARPTTTASVQAKRWGQCGGQNWSGPTVCESPWTCQVQNAWFHQCL